MLLEAFAALALILTAVGLYGVIAYAVAQRTHEIGVRMTLGATRANVVKMVLKSGLRLTAIGVAVGVVLSLLAARFYLVQQLVVWHQAHGCDHFCRGDGHRERGLPAGLLHTGISRVQGGSHDCLAL